MVNPTVVNDKDGVSQGYVQAVSDLVFGTPTGDAVTITSALSEIPRLVDREYFEIRNHPQATNNGLYRVDDATPAANSVNVRKVSGADPVVDGTGRNCDLLCTLATAVSDGVWANATTEADGTEVVDITSAGGNLPALSVGERFEVRNHSTSDNNGVYQARATVTNGYECVKLTGNAPSNAASEAVDVDTDRKSLFFDTAALGLYILEQPGSVSTAVSDAVWGTPSGATVGVTSAGNNLPAVRIGQKVNVFNHSNAANNGDYVVRGITTVNADWTLEMVSDGLTPASAVSEAVDMQTDPWVDDTGVNGQAYYSRAMDLWLADQFLMDNSQFPMFNIDSDAGKYLIGQNASGNNTGYDFVDNTEFGVRSRLMVRNMGWQAIDANGNVTAEYAAIRSNATVEDNDRDLGYYQFGTDTTTDDTVDFEFAGPVDESIKVLDASVTRAQVTPNGYDFNNTGDTIDRNDGGSFITDGYKVGGRVTVENATTSADNGTYLITAVAAGILTVTNLDGSAVTFSDTTDDNTATLTIDNRFAFSLKLRPRDDDTLGKTFAQQGLGNALATQLSNRAFVFGLGTVEDANITVTDAVITGNAPYTGMSITFYATPQTRGGGTLVGGAQTFGIIIDGNNGTAQQIYAFVQHALRQATDIDNDGDTHIGRTIDGLVRFNGSVLEFGSVDGGLTFPTNPDSGNQDGVYCDNVNSTDANNVRFWDSTNTLRSNEETIAVTLDFNQILIDDTVADSDLYYDRTIRTSVSDLVVNAGGTITSAGSNLPVLNGGDGDYIRLDGLTGDDAAMNGIYQVVTETSQASWTVTRYDGAAMATTSSAAVNVDEYPFDSPTAIVVDTNNTLTDTTISFTNPDTIGDTNSGLGVFSVGDRLRISGGVNDGLLVRVATAAAGTITIEQNQYEPVLTTAGAGGSITLIQVASIAADADFSFSYAYDSNVQGGRTVSTPAFVRAKAIGNQTAQYTDSAVLQITSGTPLTVPLQSQQERNVTV